MSNREVLIKKIEAQEKEWEFQLENLKSKAATFNGEALRNFEEQMDSLNRKLREVEKRTYMIKKDTGEIWNDLGDNIIHSWNEVAKNIDNAILKLKK